MSNASSLSGMLTLRFQDARPLSSGILDNCIMGTLFSLSSLMMAGFPSVGKSTLLTNLAGVYSEVAAYEFTTLTTVPGVIRYKGAKVQVELLSLSLSSPYPFSSSASPLPLLHSSSLSISFSSSSDLAS